MLVCFFSVWYKIDPIFPNNPYSHHGLLNDSSFYPLLEISGTIYEPCPICWDSPWWCPPCPALQSLRWTLYFSPTHVPEASSLWVNAGLVPREEVDQGLGPEALDPSGTGYLLAPLTLAISQSVNGPLAKWVQMWKLSLVSSQTLQTLLSEKLMTWGGCELAECWDGLGRLVL